MPASTEAKLVEKFVLALSQVCLGDVLGDLPPIDNFTFSEGQHYGRMDSPHQVLPRRPLLPATYAASLQGRAAAVSALRPLFSRSKAPHFAHLLHEREVELAGMTRTVARILWMFREQIVWQHGEVLIVTGVAGFAGIHAAGPDGGAGDAG